MDGPIVHVATRLREDGVALVDVGGELDAGSVRQLRDGVRGLPVVLHGNPHGRAVMDLAGLDFCDAAGLHALLDGIRELTHRGATVEVIAPERHVVRRVMAIGGVDRYFRKDDRDVDERREGQEIG